MVGITRNQKANAQREYRDDVINRVTAMRDSGKTIAAIAETLELSESSVRAIIKLILE